MTTGPNDHNYDYSFTSSSMCCQPGGWYENGIGVEPVSAYAIQEWLLIQEDLLYLGTKILYFGPKKTYNYLFSKFFYIPI